ncbi:Acidic leucine-rich nuclear phosphoprotein 32-related protein 2 [Quillaja saponaria]|uniref:Acidic leucine-rich nuclear phosphoprotein 32-related protein 2 n=1 Tax=Quillaja saponaria TaxID=32244 RepID=A0AAD7QE25_QUISA|nr:Acidic leucine-rich nuclear phosphoprotein 32-related protein 2 [Quillaja saponaria]
MDTDVKDARSCINEPLTSLDAQKVEGHANGEGDNDSNSLLPSRRGGMSKKSDKTRRKVQWNDRNGDKLAEVLEFDPSDVSDSDDDDTDTCICTIM